MMKFAASVSLAALALAGCASTSAAPAAPVVPAAAAEPASGAAPTVADAQAFVAAVEKDLADLNVISQRAAWVNATHITDDTDALAAYLAASLAYLTPFSVPIVPK